MTQLPLDLKSSRLSPQCQTVLELLTLARESGVSGVDFVHAARIFAYSQRLGQLRREHGIDIVSRRDGVSPVHRYWLSEYAPKDEAA